MQWEWVGGTQAIDQRGETTGVYGTLGVPAPENFPGSRRDGISWSDSSGLWLFGGLGFDAANGPKLLNDLWRFDATSNEWTWIAGASAGYQGGNYGALGTPAATNYPGGRRSAASWRDSSGNLWMFGGISLASNAVDYAYLNDLWKYSPSKNQWTWMGGSSSGGASGTYGTLGVSSGANVPGARDGAVSWTDTDGNLWLLGGNGYDASGSFGKLNDLWKYQLSTGTWMWMAGGNLIELAGVYGTVQLSGTGITPGCRTHSVSWTDVKGDLWLFGGYGRDATGTLGYLNDTWRFNVAANQWVWMAGSSLVGGLNGQQGIYHSWMTPDVANVPGGRQSATAWTDANGKLWLFGGIGYDSLGALNYLNDLWLFDPSSKLWTWVGGTQSVADFFGSNPGVYGIQLSPGIMNIPGGREGASGFTDAKGQHWLFGGYASDYKLREGLYQPVGLLNDLCVFADSGSSIPAAAMPVFSPIPGGYAAGQTITITDNTPNAAIYLFQDGDNSPTPYTGPINISSSKDIQAMAIAPGYVASQVASANYTVLKTSAPTLSPAPGTYSNSVTLTIADSTPGALIYYTTDGTAPTTSSMLYAGAIQVSASETIRTIGVASGFAASTTVSGTYAIWPSSAKNEWAWMGGLQSGTESNTSGIARVPDIGNVPGSRSKASSWTGRNGKFWLFGGRISSFGQANDLWQFDPSTRQWAWMSGTGSLLCAEDASSSLQCSATQPSVFGIKGQPGDANTPGGRESALTWTDANGDLWLYGGELTTSGNWTNKSASTDQHLNELWKFEPATNLWTWMSGDKASGSNCFSVTGGNTVNLCAFPAVYGTLGAPASANSPGSRIGATTWTDLSGNLWLFGGHSWDVSDEVLYFFNDLWKFAPASGQWTWEGGSSTKVGGSCFLPTDFYNQWCGKPGVYGSMGTAAGTNNPGGRSGAAGWMDSLGNLWMFGGQAFDANGQFSDLNDLWKFNPLTNQWTWIGGSSVVSGYYTEYASGVYGAIGIPSVGNIPVDRWGAAAWTDKAGNFWLFGGLESGWYGDSYGNRLSDLWTYNPTSNEWAWMGGPQPTDVFHVNMPGVFGTLNTPAPGNIPGGRYGASNWSGNDGNLWLFGGDQFGNLSNDLWEYLPSAPAPVPSFAIAAQSPSITIQQTDSGSVGLNVIVAGGFSSVVALSVSDLPTGITASFSPATITGSGFSQLTLTVALSAPSGKHTINIIGTSGSVTVTTSIDLTVTTAPPPTFSLGTSSSGLSIASGSQGALSLTVTPKYGFNAAVTFACTGLPIGAMCSFSPSSVTPNGSAVTDQLTISVNMQSASFRSSSTPTFLLGSILLLIFVPARRRWRAIGHPIILFIVAFGLGVAIGCGGGGSGGGTGGGGGSTPVTTTVTITATGGSVQQVATVALTVN